MRTTFLFLLSLVVSTMANGETFYNLGSKHLTASEINKGDIHVALASENVVASRFLSDGSNTTSFDSSSGANTFLVEKVSGGVVLKNLKSEEYFGGSGSTFGRTKSKSSAKVFTVKDITSAVENVASNSLEGHYFSFSSGGTRYLNINTNGYNSVQYATGNGCWSVFFVYPVTVEDREELNIIPAPKKVSVADGAYNLPDGFKVSVSEFSSDNDIVLYDVQNFIHKVNTATGKKGIASADGADIRLSQDVSLAEEGYVLDIAKDGITLSASTATGLFYGLQTLMKLMPANVILGKAGNGTENYALPLAKIEDEPRFPYRGFMLDVSRHFFSVEQVKKMIDLMAIYKMNVFHWHLTDDQGWRAEIKKYPSLTTTGATRSNSWNTDIHQVIENGNVYWTGVGAYTGKPYGPYFYTQEEMRDVVAYAKQRHVDVLPEIDMPGHFVAALAAYPQYSCTPNNPPTVWTNGGISNNVLNVGNDNAVQFAKNILSELCDIFPYPYFHIGGDECPTSQWESNDACKAKLARLGKTNFRALQSDFIREIGEFLKGKGKKMFCWNESVTAEGADLDIVKESDATIMCWYPCQSSATKATSLGLDVIITEFSSGCYYINRKQSTDYGEPDAAGSGNDSVEATYDYVPVPKNVSAEALKHYKGVQGTFWAEHVSSNEYLEYLAIPRFMCLAETGWSPQSLKSWSSFRKRMTEETKLLDLGGYVYARHWMEGYVHRQAPVLPIRDGATVTFTNMSGDRPRCLAEESGNINGQGSANTEWVLESTGRDGQYYIKSSTSGKYIYASKNEAGTIVMLSKINKTPWMFDTKTIAGFLAICHTSTDGLAINNNVSNKTHAHLAAHGGSNGSSFWTIQEAEVTGVKTAEVQSGRHSSEMAYNLLGQVVESPDRGIFIMNGKKILR